MLPQVGVVHDTYLMDNHLFAMMDAGDGSHSCSVIDNYVTVHHDAVTHVVHHDAVTHVIHHPATTHTVHHDEVGHWE